MNLSPGKSRGLSPTRPNCRVPDPGFSHAQDQLVRTTFGRLWIWVSDSRRPVPHER